VTNVQLKEKNPKAADYMFSFTAEDEKRCEPLRAATLEFMKFGRALNISLGHWEGALRK